MEVAFNFSNLTIEAMFNLTSAAAFKNGILVDRAKFWATNGQLYCTPAALLRLFELGVHDIFWLGQFAAPVKAPRGILNGRG